MSGLMQRRRIWLTLGGVALSAGLAVHLFGGSREAPVAAPHDAPSQERASAPAPYRDRVAFPGAQPATEPAEAPPPAEATAATAPPPPHRPLPGVDIRVPGSGPPAPPQTASGWVTSYREAVCGCATRECVRALQTRFVRAIGSTNWDEERDGAAYAQASREAIKCYSRLPADS
jgi:hypothetical protein